MSENHMNNRTGGERKAGVLVPVCHQKDKTFMISTIE